MPSFHSRVVRAFAVVALATASLFPGPIARAGGALTVNRVWARDAKGHDITQVKPGDGIQYTAFVTNSGSNALNANFHIETYWGTRNDGQLQVFDHIFPFKVAPGLAGYYTPTTVPGDALPGDYTIRFYVAVSGTSDQATGTGGVHMKGTSTKMPNIRYWNQYQIHSKGSRDCGPTSIAIALSRYNKGPGGGADGIREIRSKMGAPGNVDTSDGQIEKGLRAYSAGVEKIDFTNLPRPARQLGDMAIAVIKQQPVVVFIEASALHRVAGGHWLVLVGFHDDGDTTFADLYDPDENPVPRGGGDVFKGGRIAVPVGDEEAPHGSTFAEAVNQGITTQHQFSLIAQ